MASNIKWTLEKIKSGFKSFYNEYGHYPTSHEIDSYSKLPSARQIQRSFGGLVGIRKSIGLKDLDFTKGKYSSNRAHKINERAHKTEQEVYSYLIKHFGVEFVHREYFFNDDRRNRIDFFIYYKDGSFSVDVFYPDNIRIVNGCLNSKLKTYKGLILEYPIIFLMMNESISKEELKNLIKNKKSILKSNQRIMTYMEFKDFCESKGRNCRTRYMIKRKIVRHTI